MFKKATKKAAKLKLAITGPSGSGKTYSALRIAKGLGKKIAVIDTENASAALYSDKFDFDIVEINPPYTNDKYLRAIEASLAEKYDVLIIDSLTHAWAAEGGLLDKKQGLDSRGGNSYTNWASITKEHELLKSRILLSDIHMICTMRSKQEYVMEQNDKGKSIPKKVGLAPIQREGLEYEFTVVFDLGMDHQAMVSKDRTSLFDGKIWVPDESTGTMLLNWLNDIGSSSVVDLTPNNVPPLIQTDAAAADLNSMLHNIDDKTKKNYENFIPKAGQYVGKRLGDINIEELQKYRATVEAAAKLSKNDLPQPIKETLFVISCLENY